MSFSVVGILYYSRGKGVKLSATSSTKPQTTTCMEGKFTVENPNSKKIRMPPGHCWTIISILCFNDSNKKIARPTIPRSEPEMPFTYQAPTQCQHNGRVHRTRSDVAEWVQGKKTTTRQQLKVRRHLRIILADRAQAFFSSSGWGKN